MVIRTGDKIKNRKNFDGLFAADGCTKTTPPDQTAANCSDSKLVRTNLLNS